MGSEANTVRTGAWHGTIPPQEWLSFAPAPYLVSHDTGRVRCESETKLDRLIFLLSLSDTERAFLNATVSEGADAWLVYADWLEEQGRLEHAARARKAGVSR